MKIKFSIVNNDMDGGYLSDVGELESNMFDGYVLFCKLYERMEGEGIDCGVDEDEFNERYEVMDMGDWLVVRDNNGEEVISFVRG
jgi:hypothetical protein